MHLTVNKHLGREKYKSLTAASNGRLYAAPFCASRVLEIDPDTGVTRHIGDELPSLRFLGYTDVEYRYASIAAGANGLLYAAPCDASRVLEIDPAAGVTRLIGDTLVGMRKYCSVAAASNGRLYAAPLSAPRILEIDPITGATRYIGDELQGHMKYLKLAWAPAHRRLYAAPYYASRVLEIDLDAERLSWVVLLLQLEKLNSRDGYGDIKNQISVEPGVWIMTQIGDTKGDLSQRILELV